LWAGDELLIGDNLGWHGGIDALLAVPDPFGNPHRKSLLE
jgi:hypothetical protein